MSTMPFAPLRYTLAMARFPRNMNLARHVPAFQELVRGRYPLMETLQNRAVNLKVGPQGAEVETVADEIWQFSEANRSHAIILGGEYLVLHAGTGYEGHEKFVGRFGEILDAYCNVDGLQTVLIGAGYRYVDLVVPRANTDETLGHYLEPWALPRELLDVQDDGVEPLDSIFVGGFKTSQGVMRLQVIRRPFGILPPDLDTKFVRDNGWVEQRPENDFAVLDIDHGTTLGEPAALSSEFVKQLLVSLRIPPARLFARATTDYAREVWEGKK
jgi:uncharacterized protein (TIGR04255 family)